MEQGIMTIQIKISGPGGTMLNELTAIKEALEKTGAEVTLVSEYPEYRLGERTLDELLIERDRVRKEIIQAIPDFKPHLKKIVIELDQLPWGG